MAIQQTLHTKLVQKLILTPSLQQAIKLLLMTTLELVDLLNQEVVENPLLGEVPADELQPDAQAQVEEKTDAGAAAPEKGDAWDDEEDHPMEKLDVLEDRRSPDTIGLLQRRDVIGELTRPVRQERGVAGNRAGPEHAIVAVPKRDYPIRREPDA
jgi:hypothetical protein